ncbi:uncharacterized protein LOC124846099, partial [Vigna umbellata]|uniref:uncharacterized protein LOC124846099 n=1 Tax=Vigna umbellata TaxID=87088 RepID=UPI001F5EC8CE
MNPDVAAASDVPNIKIKIPGDDESHDQTPPPVAASHASSSDSVDEITNSVHDLYWHALEDQWDKMLPIVENDPNCVRIQLTGLGDTALHVAANAGSTRFVKELVKLMRPEDVLIPNKEGMLPVHLAALSFHHRIVQLLCSDHLLDKMAYEDIKKLFFMTISSNMFGKCIYNSLIKHSSLSLFKANYVAIKLFEKHPVELTSARDEEQLTSLHLLARKPYKVLRESSESGSNEEEIETEEEKREDKEKKSSSHSDSIDKTETAFLVAARTMVNELLERISSVIHNLNAKNSKCYK